MRQSDRALSAVATKRRFPLLVSVAALLCSLGSGLALSACGNGDSPASWGGSSGVDPAAASPAPTSADDASTGSISLALDVGGARLNAADYTIVGSQFQKTGSLDVSNSTRIAAVIGDIPFGTNYAVTLSASSTDPTATTCNGSAAFDITSANLVTVPVHLVCKQQKVSVATPAPIPPLAALALLVALLALGVALQRRAAQSFGELGDR